MRPNNNTLCVSLLMLVTLLLAAFLPTTSALAERTLAVPAPKSPYGYIIDTTPTFKWSVVSGAASYQFKLYQGPTLIYQKDPGSSACDATVCTRTPTEVLALGEYKWRVRAKQGTTWSAWSSYKYFTLIPPSVSFNSNFNGSMRGWTKKAGGTWEVSATALHTLGLEDMDTSIYRSTGNYTNFTYEASIRRVDGNLFNYMAVRMGNQLTYKNRWYPGYYFGYSNNGHYSIWRQDSASVEVPLVYNLASDDIVENGWNNLKVVADGNSFEFYINGVLQTSFHDSTYSSGLVGFLVPQLSAPLNEFQVDWARLAVIH